MPIDIDIDDIPAELVKTCPECGGRGELATSHWYTCPECKGRGKVIAPAAAELIARLTQETE
jgi:DnaJ-class molecular chaperone